MELYGFMEREKKIPSYFFIITKYTSINGIDTYIYLTYSLSGLAKYQIYDYDFLKFRNHLKENLCFWGDNIPLINPKKQCLGVYFFYDYKVKQVRLTGKP